MNSFQCLSETCSLRKTEINNYGTGLIASRILPLSSTACVTNDEVVKRKKKGITKDQRTAIFWLAMQVDNYHVLKFNVRYKAEQHA